MLGMAGSVIAAPPMPMGVMVVAHGTANGTDGVRQGKSRPFGFSGGVQAAL